MITKEIIKMYDTIIVGGGVAGLGAAVYCGRFELKTLVLADKIGGTIILTGDIYNYPGFKKISGMELADKIKEHAGDYGIEIKEEKVSKIEKHGNFFKVNGYKTKTIIFATGTEWRKLNVRGEKEFSGKGVHYCSLCDGVLYKNKIVCVVGGSDSAAKEALMLTQWAKKVYIIYRKEKIRAEPINLKRVQESKKIEVINNTNVVSIKGDKFVNAVVFDKAYKGSKEFKLDAVFVEIGHIPVSGLAKGIGVKLNDKNEIIVDKDSKTNIKGFYACGDVVDSKFKQAITGVAEGVIAAYNAYEYLTKELPV